MANRGRGENPGGNDRGGGAEDEPAPATACGIGPVLNATPEVEKDGPPTGENPWTGVKKTPEPNGVPRRGGSVGGVGAEPRTRRSGIGGGAGAAGTALAGARGGRQLMGDGARSADARSRPEFWSPASQRSWMLAMRWSTGVRGRRGGGHGGAIGGEERKGR